METQNRLVDQATKENYSSQDNAGIWEYYIEDGALRSGTIGGGLSGDDIEPSEMCDSLEDFESELSDNLDRNGNRLNLAFSGLTEEERKIQDNWIKLRKVVEHGYIVHVASTGEEWLTDMEDIWILAYTRGSESDWNTQEALDSGVQVDEKGLYPSDGQPGYVEGKIYFQKNREVNNPSEIYEFQVYEDHISGRNVI